MAEANKLSMADTIEVRGPNLVKMLAEKEGNLNDPNQFLLSSLQKPQSIWK